MKVYGDYESVNFATGDKSRRVTGQGESILVSDKSPTLCGTRFHGSGLACVKPRNHWGRHSWAGTEPSDPFGG